MITGVIILGHGSNTEMGEANRVLVELAGMVAKEMSLEIMEVAFVNEKSKLQGLEQAIDKLARAGARRIIVTPVFLTNGMHMRKGIPDLLARAGEKYPDREITMTGHIGADPRLAGILVEKLEKAFGQG